MKDDTRPIVLVVDDEPALVQLVSRILEPAGYQVLTATSGAEALEVSRTMTEPIDLLLTDLRMPEMTGRSLATTLRGTQLGLKVLYFTAYSDELFGRATQLEPHESFIEKPIAARALREAVALHLYGTLRAPNEPPEQP